MSVYPVDYVSYIAPDGLEYPFFGGRRALLNITDLGNTDVDYLTDQGPFQNGVTVRDYRIPSRNIDIQAYERGCKRIDHWDNLGILNNTTRPNRRPVNQTGVILVILPDGTQREIDARRVSGARGSWDYQGSLTTPDMMETIRFFCADPIWRDPTLVTENFEVEVADACMPICMPFCLDSGIINTTFTINYAGTFKSYPTIQFIGPLVNPVVSILPTNQTIEMSYSISAGELVTIALSEQISTVTNNSGTNLIGTVKDQNDLATFSIEVDDIAPNGVNVIQVIGSGGVTGQSGIIISYYTRYLGIPK